MDDRSLTRRAFLSSALSAASAALLPGCLGLESEPTPAPAPWPPLRFAHVGGFLLTGKEGRHDGRPLRRTISRALAALERMESILGLDFVLLSGDLIANLDASDARVFLEVRKAAGRPWLVVPGAAEAAGRPGCLAKKEFLALCEGMGPEAGRGWWARKVGRRAQVVGLDTTVEGRARGRVSAEQLSFLRSFIDDHPDELVVVLAHHPPVAAPDANLPAPWRRAHGIENLAEVQFTLEAGENVKLVFSGNCLLNHVHSLSGLHVVTTPSTCLFPAAFREVVIKGRRVDLTYHSLLDREDEARLRADLAASDLARAYNAEVPQALAATLLGGPADRTTRLTLR